MEHLVTVVSGSCCRRSRRTRGSCTMSNMLAMPAEWRERFGATESEQKLLVLAHPCPPQSCSRTPASQQLPAARQAYRGLELARASTTQTSHVILRWGCCSWCAVARDPGATAAGHAGARSAAKALLPALLGPAERRERRAHVAGGRAAGSGGQTAAAAEGISRHTT